MFEKLFIDVGPQDIEDYGWGSSTSISEILVGPKNVTIPVLITEWRETTWKPRMITRKGVTKPGRQKYSTIPFRDWLIKEKGFTVLDPSLYEIFGDN